MDCSSLIFIFPNNIPTSHQQILYNHFGELPINPNLYETGSSSEVWNPKSSTILQVLLSFQALVLNEKPYLNEAGYDTQIGKTEGEKNSISYNLNAFLVSCRFMLYKLCKLPQAYMQGAPIGYPFSCSSNSSSKNAEKEKHKGSSTGFKMMLNKLFPRLVQAFSDKGFDCTNMSDQVP